MTKQNLLDFAEKINQKLNEYNYQINPKYFPNGKPGKINKNDREYRLQLKDSQQLNNDVTNIIWEFLVNYSANDITHNTVSPNSSKFSSISAVVANTPVDIVLSTGFNKGEKFEIATLNGLQRVVANKDLLADKQDRYVDLLDKLQDAHPDFFASNIHDVQPRKGSTRKSGKDKTDLGHVIGDVILYDSLKTWPVSIKASNGDTFSSYPGAASLFMTDGKINTKSPLISVLGSFGVDFEQLQTCYDKRNGFSNPSPNLPTSYTYDISSFFEQAWGVDYFYARGTTKGWQVFWLDQPKLHQLSTNIQVTEIRYPSDKSKQLSIFCENGYKKYLIEVRNSAGGEYPNDMKVKVKNDKQTH